MHDKNFLGARKESVSSFLLPIVVRMSQTGMDNSTAFKHDSSRYDIHVGQNVIRWTFFMLNIAKVSLNEEVLLALF